MVKCLTGSKSVNSTRYESVYNFETFPMHQTIYSHANLCYGILFLAHILHHSPDLSCIAIFGILDKLCENTCAIVHTCLPEIAY